MSELRSRTSQKQARIFHEISVLDIILEFVLGNRWKDYKKFSRALSTRVVRKRPTTARELHAIIENMNHPFFAFNHIRKKDFAEHFPSRELLLQSRKARPVPGAPPSSTTRTIHKRKGISKRLRYLILERDHFQCKSCGRTARETKLEVDHIISIAKGGMDSINNLRTLCRDCNRGKSDLSLHKVN